VHLSHGFHVSDGHAKKSIKEDRVPARFGGDSGDFMRLLCRVRGGIPLCIIISDFINRWAFPLYQLFLLLLEAAKMVRRFKEIFVAELICNQIIELVFLHPSDDLQSETRALRA
jgi:hypothetical protein